MSFIEIFKLVVQLLPLLIDAIKAVEAAIPESGQGKMKLDLIRSALESSHFAAGQVNFEALWAVVSKLVNSIVGIFNSTGIFSK